MARRFTDTEKWNDEWFLKLPPHFKLLSDFLWNEVDFAGIWQVNKSMAEFKIGLSIPWNEAPEAFKGRIYQNGCYWFMPVFLKKQYGESLNKGDAVKSAGIRLKEKGFYDVALSVFGDSLRRVYRLSPQSGGRAKAKAKAKAKAVKTLGKGCGEGDTTLVPSNAFDTIWQKYPRRLGKKTALRHFTASVKTPQDWLDIQNAMDNFIRKMQSERRANEYVPYGSSWFNGWQEWISYKGVDMPPTPKPLPKPPEVLPPDPTEADLVEMHNAKVSALGKCRTACEICETKGKI